MTPTMTPELNQALRLNLAKMMMATKNFFKSIAAIGHDDYEIYVLEKELKPTYQSNHFSGQNPYSGAFSA
ncbi:MAG: hypothetical protein J0L82_15845 [Deltaproteobacteria bacterium]|nr:hypothetical protein [Deltaproteobacteria bacterium]